MLFTSLQYLIFLPIVVALFWILPKQARLPMLLVASYIFYASWNPPFVFLIILLTYFNWLWGAFMHRHQNERNRRLLLGAGIAGNLLTLCYFKYANFLVGSLCEVIHLVNHTPQPHWVLNIVLPLGISFFTFEFIHYLFEIYRGNKPVDSFVLFALFAAFFPTQIAGPVKRYPDFVAQMKEERTLKLADFDEGIPLIIMGMAKKLLIANNLAILVQMGFANPFNYGAPELWLLAYAFTFQIYFDFSAYTDIGRGSAMLFGYHIPINFNLPLIADNMSEFWHRWHISLSTWLRDYLFIPMGGSRGSKWRTNWNLFVTMALGGLWHGAAWNFVVWGLYHGVCLIAHREFAVLRGKLPALNWVWKSKPYHYLSVLLTFNAVAVGCVFFGMTNISAAFVMVRKMILWRPIFTSAEAGSFFLLRSELPLVVPVTLAITVLLLLVNYPLGNLIKKDFFARIPGPCKAAYWSALVILMVMFVSDAKQPFIYFQF
ncbi:MAG TPA: MBOAT family O-acyltransferase [Chroococcales cyanobacterium]